MRNPKYVVIYHSWQWDVAIFCQSGWDIQHLLPYIFFSLQGFLCNLARSLGEDTTLNVLQMLDKHYGVNMTHLLGDDMNTEEGVAVLREQKKLMLYQGALYYHHTPAGELEAVCSLQSPWLIEWLP